MREFFKGWRRKVGCVALLMAVAVFGIWMRSRIVLDDILFTFGDRQISIASFGGCCLWWSWSRRDGDVSRNSWTAIPLNQLDEDELLRTHEEIREELQQRQPMELAIFYLLLVLPLTLLSAYLILWNPRPNRRIVDAR